MLELPHDAIVILLGDTFRITNGALDESFQATLEQLIHLIVIVIVVPDAEHALYIVPDRPSEARRIDLTVRSHGVVCQIVRGLEFIVEEITDVVVKTIHQRITVIVPRVILDAKGRYVVQLTALEGKNKRVALRIEGTMPRNGKKKTLYRRKIARDEKLCRRKKKSRKLNI